MQDEPRPAEIIEIVADFLKAGRSGEGEQSRDFQLRVAAAALDLVSRELALAEATDAEERRRLEALLGRSGTLLELNHALCADIAAGRIDAFSSPLRDHFWRTTLAKLTVDQPRYPAYLRAIAQSTPKEA